MTFNYALRERILKHVEADVNSFNMTNWIGSQDAAFVTYQPTNIPYPIRYSEAIYMFSNDDTTACIGGFAVLLSQLPKENIENFIDFQNHARYALGLTTNQAERLFYFHIRGVSFQELTATKVKTW